MWGKQLPSGVVVATVVVEPELEVGALVVVEPGLEVGAPVDVEPGLELGAPVVLLDVLGDDVVLQRDIKSQDTHSD